MPLPSEPYRYAEWRRCRRRPRLPRRGRRALLLGAVPADPRGGRGAASPTPPSRCSTAACGLRATRARPCGDGTRRSPSTCRARTAATPTGRRQRMMRAAAKIGPATVALVEAIMRAKPHPEQGFRSCLGILRLAQDLWRRPARGGLPPRRRHRRDAATARSPPSSRPASTRPHADPKRRTARRSGTPTSVAVATTTDATRGDRDARPASTTHERLVALGLTGMAKALRGATAAARHRRAHLRGAARAHDRPRGHRAREQAARQPTEVRQPAPVGRRRGCRHEGAARSRQGIVRTSSSPATGSPGTRTC